MTSTSTSTTTEHEAGDTSGSAHGSGSVLRSAAHLFGTRMVIQVLWLFKAIAVARLLGPSDLGEFFLVSAVVGALEISSHPGLNDALVAAAGVKLRQWQATWTFLVVRGALISAVLILAAAPVAEWLHASEITSLLRVAALMPFIRSLTSLSLDWTARRVDLRPTANTELVAQAVELTVGVTLAALTRSPWALVIAMLIGASVRALWSFRYRGFRPRFVFSLHEVRPLMRFSKWRFVSNLVYYLSVQADDLLVGRYLGNPTRSITTTISVVGRFANR